MRQTERDSQYGKYRTVQPGEDTLNRESKTGPTEQDCQHRTVRTVLSRHPLTRLEIKYSSLFLKLIMQVHMKYLFTTNTVWQLDCNHHGGLCWERDVKKQVFGFPEFWLAKGVTTSLRSVRFSKISVLQISNGSSKSSFCMKHAVGTEYYEKGTESMPACSLPECENNHAKELHNLLTKNPHLG